MKKLMAMWTAMLLVFCLSLTAAADSRWYYDGENRRWKFYSAGDFVRNKWLQDPADHHWYYLDHDGWMLTGIHELDGIRYRFRDQPHQGNYIPDGMTDSRGSGFYAYRANGRPTYGSLVEILGESARSGRSAWTAENDSIVTTMPISTEEQTKDRTEARIPDPPKSVPEKSSASDLPKPQPEKSSASNLPKPQQKASASDISRIDPDIPTSSDIPTNSGTPTDPGTPTEPGDENERRQELEEDERIHSHTDRDAEYCIAYDSWQRILAHPLDYEACFENRCTSRLYLTGGEEDFAFAKSLIRSPLRHQTGTRQSSCREAHLIGEEDFASAKSLMRSPLSFREARLIDEELHIPIYVSLLCAPSESSGSLELVQAYAAEALRLPMRPETDPAQDTEEYRGNAGGAAVSLPWTLLNGGTYHWTESDGTDHSRTYDGFQLCSWEDGKYRTLPLKKTEVTGSEGFSAETRLAEDLWEYLFWRDDGFSGSADISFLTRYKGKFHFLSEQDIFGDCAASVPLPERMAHFYPAAEDSWRSTESYWLSSTPCPGVYVTDLPDYLDFPDAALPPAVAGLDDTLAQRHYLLYDTAAQLSPALFADPARADRPVGSADAAEAQAVRIRVSAKC